MKLSSTWESFKKKLKLTKNDSRKLWWERDGRYIIIDDKDGWNLVVAEGRRQSYARLTCEEFQNDPDD